MTWKFFALYKAGQQKEIWRFICIFLFNTFGLLPIIYLLVDCTKEDIELWEKRNNIEPKIKQSKKIKKGGVKTWKSATSGGKQKETQNVSLKRNKVNTTKK